MGFRVESLIADDGIGIAPEALPSVFEPFRQVDDDEARSRGVSGLGLGLAIVEHVSAAHGGSASVTSAGRGKGTTFTVLLPGEPPELRDAV